MNEREFKQLKANLQGRYGRNWKSAILRMSKNWPFGRNSTPRFIVTLKGGYDGKKLSTRKERRKSSRRKAK